MAKLLYLGRNSFRIITKDKVLYLDPFAGDEYEMPADLILVTHQHRDHNQVGKVKKKKDCIIITNQESLIDGKYQRFVFHDIKIRTVPAYNSNHAKEQSVGYVLEIEGLLLYFSGDTSKIDEMQCLRRLNIDYAFLCTDGYWNMGPLEASECAHIINAKHNIPVHTSSDGIFDLENAQKFIANNVIILKPNTEIVI